MPLPDAFFPTDDDRAAAAARGERVRVSVWDSRRATVPDVLRYRAAADAIVFAIEVRLAVAVVGPVAIAVVEDPEGVPPHLPPEAKTAHAGIEGLERQPGEPRPLWRTRLQHIADLTRRAA